MSTSWFSDMLPTTSLPTGALPAAAAAAVVLARRAMTQAARGLPRSAAAVGPIAEQRPHRVAFGAVEGENVELSPYDEGRGTAVIRWKWRFTTWQPGVQSEVTLTFSEQNGGTVLELTQTGVPDEEKERTEKGWKGLLLDRIKAMLGGSVLK